MRERERERERERMGKQERVEKTENEGGDRKRDRENNGRENKGWTKECRKRVLKTEQEIEKEWQIERVKERRKK